MSEFRTHKEMDEIYDKLEGLPGRGHPYCITLHKPNRYFGFIGTSHSPEPEHPQWRRYFEEWELFIGSSNRDKVVLYEGRSTAPDVGTKEEAIRKGADNGLTVWLAQHTGIQYYSPEPDRAEEITALKKMGYSEDELITYYIGRQVPQWMRRDKQDYPNLDDYITSILRYLEPAKWDKLYKTVEARRLVENALSITKLESATYEQLNYINNPALNNISSECSKIRDKSIFDELKKAWYDGKDIFCVYGSGHAIVLEPALKELINEV